MMQDDAMGQVEAITIDKQIVCDSGSIFIVRMHASSESDTTYMWFAMSIDSSTASIWPVLYWTEAIVDKSYHRLLRVDSLPQLVDTGVWWQRPDVWSMLKGWRIPEMTITRVLPEGSRR